MRDEKKVVIAVILALLSFGIAGTTYFIQNNINGVGMEISIDPNIVSAGQVTHLYVKVINKLESEEIVSIDIDTPQVSGLSVKYIDDPDAISIKPKSVQLFKFDIETRRRTPEGKYDIRVNLFNKNDDMIKSNTYSFTVFN